MKNTIEVSIPFLATAFEQMGYFLYMVNPNVREVVCAKSPLEAVEWYKNYCRVDMGFSEDDLEFDENPQKVDWLNTIWDEERTKKRTYAEVYFENVIKGPDRPFLASTTEY